MTVPMLERELAPLSRPVQGGFLAWLYRHLPPRAIQDRGTNRLYGRAVGVLMEALELGGLSSRDARDVEDYLRTVVPLIEEFESKEFPMEDPAPEDMLRFFMDQHKLSQYDLAAELGGQSVVSTILSGKRKLNRRQIERLAARFHISPAVFYPRR